MSARDKHPVKATPAFTAAVPIEEVRRIIAGRMTQQNMILHYADLPLLEEEVAVMPLEQQEEILRDLPFFQRFKLIELSEYPAELVRSMPGHELLYTMKEVGESTGLELLTMATEQQLQTVLDVDTWAGNEMDADATMDYLFKLINLNPNSVEQINGVDDMTLLLAIVTKIRVVRKEWFEEHEEIDPDNFLTLDDFYSFEWRDPDAANEPTWAVLSQLYKLDTPRYMWVMEAAIHEMPENLTEECFRDREGRMSDLGFPDYLFALGILQREKPSSIVARIRKGEFPKDDSLVKDPSEKALPVLYAAVPHGELLFNAALKGLPDPWIAAINHEIMLLANRVIIARHFESEYELAAEGVEYTRDCLNTGLDYLAEGSLEQAQALLRGTDLYGLFRLGHNLGFAVRDRARTILRSRAGHVPVKDIPLLAAREREFLTGIVADFPQFHTGFAAEGNPEEKHRHFRYASDYRQAMRALDRIETMLAFLLDVLKTPMEFFSRKNLAPFYPSEPGQITPDHVFNTAMICRVVDGDFLVRGLTPADVDAFMKAVAPQGVIDESIRDDLGAWLASMGETFNDIQLELLQKDILGSFDILTSGIRDVYASHPRRYSLLGHVIFSSAVL